jgi:hypothetical protein
MSLTTITISSKLLINNNNNKLVENETHLCHFSLSQYSQLQYITLQFGVALPPISIVRALIFQIKNKNKSGGINQMIKYVFVTSLTRPFMTVTFT